MKRRDDEWRVTDPEILPLEATPTDVEKVVADANADEEEEADGP